MNDKADRLEETLAHQEQQIQDLNDVVTKQWAEIDRLTKMLGRLKDKVEDIEVSKGDDGEGLSVIEEAALNKPPHY
ncbi:MAG: slyX family protein [Micavibrio sp.]|nr:slyX family protein [Micavibrio sp.]|tara:strand:- start:67 stop:294 length:228 start_codon:yes stop_codon:yes gene_type:complete